MCRIWAARHSFLNEITIKTHLHCLFPVCLGWLCLFKAKMAFVHCGVSAEQSLVESRGLVTVSRMSALHSEQALARPEQESFFIKIE